MDVLIEMEYTTDSDASSQSRQKTLRLDPDKLAQLKNSF
jgi:hypothetical protein